MNLHRSARSHPPYLYGSLYCRWCRYTQAVWADLESITMASQMSDAELEKTIAKIAISTNKEKSSLPAVRNYWLTVFWKYTVKTATMRIWMKTNRKRRCIATACRETTVAFKRNEGHRTFQPPAPRYTELLGKKTGKELGIGRLLPTLTFLLSWNAGTYWKNATKSPSKGFRILTLVDTKGRKVTERKIQVLKIKLFPTDLGLVVTDFPETSILMILWIMVSRHALKVSLTR